MDIQIVTITDEYGKVLNCYVEHRLDLADQEYWLLFPVDNPVEIFTWSNEEEDEPILVEDEDEIEEVFETAKAVLAEQNLILKRTAIALTAEGELPELDEETELDGGILTTPTRNGQKTPGEDEAEEVEELQLLASFYHQEQEYTIYAPLEPFFILARVGPDGKPQLLSDDEFQQMEAMLPILEDKLFESLE